MVHVEIDHNLKDDLDRLKVRLKPEMEKAHGDLIGCKFCFKRKVSHGDVIRFLIDFYNKNTSN